MEDLLWSKTTELMERMEKIIESSRPAPAPIQTDSTGTTAIHPRKKYSGLSVKEFQAMSLYERNDVYQENPEKYTALVNEIRAGK